MIAPFPHHYEVSVRSTGAGQGIASANGRALTCGPPPQFGGQPSWWSPEELLIASAALCLMTTFDALAARERLEVSHYESRAEGVLDKTREGILFTSITLHVDVDVAAASDVARAERVLAAAHRYCIVSNALKPSVQVRTRVRPIAPLAAAG
jgi:organic hydroperoxide reductase OsmC/OhrA